MHKRSAVYIRQEGVALRSRPDNRSSTDCAQGYPDFNPVMMDERFEIPVLYRGQAYSFPATLRMRGYVRQFRVDVGGIEVIFECDEEENYRALLEELQLKKNPHLDVSLLKAIAQVLESVTHQ